MEDVFWDKLSDKRKSKIAGKLRRLAAHVQTPKPARMSPVVWGKLFALRQMHRHFIKKGGELSLDGPLLAGNLFDKMRKSKYESAETTVISALFGVLGFYCRLLLSSSALSSCSQGRSMSVRPKWP